MPATPPATPHDDGMAELDAYRKSIDNLDAALVALLAERFHLTQKVGRLKAALDLPPADPAREAAQIRRLRRLAEDADLDPTFAEKMLAFIIAEVLRHHESIKRDVAAASARAGSPDAART